MKCYEVQAHLVGYLERETSPADRALIEAHLDGCAACQVELHSLAAARTMVGLGLHHLGDPAEPPLQAWEQLEARLAREDRLSPPARPGLFVNAGQLHSGGFIMSGKLKLALGLTSGTMLAAALALVAYFTFRTPTPVSAQEIIQRATAAQAAKAPASGITYWHSQGYNDVQVLTSGIPNGATQDDESYENLATGQYRMVATNPATGSTLSVFGFDGMNLYQSDESNTTTGASPLTVYKGLAPAGWLENYGIHNGPDVDQKAVFEAMSKAPDVEYVGQQTWDDGRSVYVIRSAQAMDKLFSRPEGKNGPAVSVPALKGYTMMYFDAKTYDEVEDKTVAEINGKEVVVTSFKTLANKILPASTAVAWDLSDVSGISLVDDPTGEKLGGPWRVNTTPEEMASRGLKVYKLKTVPAGFTEHVTGSEVGAQEQMYIVEYKNADGGFADIQSVDSAQNIIDQPTEIYTTASGLTVYFQGTDTPEVATHKGFWFVAVKTPDTTFVITSNLPLATLKQMTEDLVEIK